MSKLILPHEIFVRKHKEREVVVTLTKGPHAGRRARIHWDDSGTVRHVTSDEHQDALVTPRSGTIKVPYDPEWIARSPLFQRLLREERHERQG